jgi:glycosyltransferase involved in cell wall biosynthesis
MEILSLFIFLFWVFKGLDLCFGIVFGVPKLKRSSVPQQNAQDQTVRPKVSIIFAGRNEEEDVRDAVESMLAQDYPDFEVIAVNDRSTDRTLAVLESLSSPKDSIPFRILTIETLPPGWLGKAHALYQGYLVSSGEWLLFTDADVLFAPSTLTAALHAAEKEHLDHLSLWPNLVTRNYLEALFVNSFSFLYNLRYRPWAARQSHSLAYVGVGSFNLIRRGVYDKIGTHKRIALEVADDMMLGKLVKRSGFRQMLMQGRELVSERWVEGLQGVVRILEKNAFAGLNYSVFLLLGTSVALVFFDIVPFLAVFFAEGLALYFFAGSLAILFLIHLAGQKYQPLALATFPMHPLGSLLMLFVIWRSAITILKNKGVWWRETFYSLETLKKGMKAKRE